MARDAAVAHGLPTERFVLQIGVESVNYAENVITCRLDSPAGARGIAQLMPVHWSQVDPCDPHAALDYAARLMRGHWDYWRGQGKDDDTAYGLALSSYNAGRQATIDGLAGKKAWWPFAETVTYLIKILQIDEGQARAIMTGVSAVGDIKLSEVLALGHSRVGDPYVWDGEQPGGFDCSGFIKWVYNGTLTSFTDSILGETDRVENPAPGDIVLYEYKDTSQPGVRFPHVGLFLSDTETLDARFGHGVGVHPQLPRTQAARYYRRKLGVIVDTLGEPSGAAPVPDPRDARIAQLEAEKAQLISTLGYLTGDVAGAIQAALDTLKRHAPAA